MTSHIHLANQETDTTWSSFSEMTAAIGSYLPTSLHCKLLQFSINQNNKMSDLNRQLRAAFVEKLERMKISGRC